MMRAKSCSQRYDLEQLVSKSRGSSSQKGYTWVNGRFTNSPRSGPKNGPDFQRNTKSKRRLQAATKKRPYCKKLDDQRGIFDVSSEDTEYLKVIAEARAKLETCGGSSMPCIPKDEVHRET